MGQTRGLQKDGEGGVAGSQPMSTVTQEPK
jgi:hypothetical protein